MFTELSINELFRAVGFKNIRVIPEPHLTKNILKKTVRQIISTILGKIFSLDSRFINTTNIIGIAEKIQIVRDEK